MRTLLVLALSALTCSAFAQPTTPAAPAPAQPADYTVTPAADGVTVPGGKAVKTTELEGGLVVEDLKIGDGYEVKPGGAVVANYHGWIKDGGKVFDSTYDPAFKHNEPAGFSLGSVIEGWQKGVPGMKIGGIRRLIIPSKLAYGERGNPSIPPNSDLVFVIQLINAVQTEDEKVGDGEELVTPFLAETNYTIKDKDGKVVEQSDPKHPFIWIPNEFQGLQYGMEGMKVGGKRKISIPKEFNHSNPQLAPESRPQDVDVTVEVECINARVLRPKTPTQHPAPHATPAPQGK